LFEFLGIKETA